jgi:hypothetical protein
VHHVTLSDGGCSCECRGFIHNRRCKHVSALRALRAAGRI